MVKSYRLKEYERLQNEFISKFQKELSDFKDELDNSDLPPGTKAVLVRKFIKDHNTYKTLNVKYDNFIMDIRKPSFMWFLFWCFCSILGFIQIVKYIINLF